MRQTLDGDGLDERIRENDLLAEQRRRVAFVGGLDVRAQQLAHFAERVKKMPDDRRGAAGRPFGIANAHAFAHLILQQQCPPRTTRSRVNSARVP